MMPVLNRSAARRRPVVAAGGPFAGYALWLDPTQIVGLSDGGPVSTWADQSGNGYDVTQSGAARPTFVAADGDTGLPAVAFTSSQGLSRAAAGFSVPQPCTVIAVVKFDVAATTLFLCDGDGSGDRVAPIFNYPAVGSTRVFCGAEAAAAPVPAGGAWLVYTARLNGAASTTRVNGTGGAAFNPGTQGFAGIVVGNRFSLGLGITGRIADFFVYPSDLSDAAAATTEAYVAAKYGL